MMNQQL